MGLGEEHGSIGPVQRFMEPSPAGERWRERVVHVTREKRRRVDQL
jgi:hypothetical protein